VKNVQAIQVVRINVLVLAADGSTTMDVDSMLVHEYGVVLARKRSIAHRQGTPSASREIEQVDGAKAIKHAAVRHRIKTEHSAIIIAMWP